MDISTRYHEDMDRLSNKKIIQIVLAAKEEFYAHGIREAKFSVIASHARISQATIYRYIHDKTDLAKIVALEYWRDISTMFEEYYIRRVNALELGLEKVRMYLSIFIELYRNHQPFLKFMEDFDNYMLSMEETNSYSSFEQYVYKLKETYLEAFSLGMQDGSIKTYFDPEKMYSFVSQVMVSTTQKLSLRVGREHMFDESYPIECLNRLIDMHIQYIKK